MRDYRQKALFYIGFTVFLAASLLEDTLFAGSEPLGRVIGIIRYASLVPLLIKIIFYTNYEPRQLIIYAVYGVFGIIVYLKSGLQIPIAILPFWMAIDGIPYRSIARIYLYCGLAIGLITICSCVLGLIPNRVLDAKGAYGFVHPNQPGILSVTVMMSYMIVRDDKLRIWEAAIMIVITFLIYSYTQCDGALIASIVMLILAAGTVINRDGVLANVSEWLGIIGFPLLWGLNYLLQLLYGKVDFVTNELDEFFTHRLSLADKGLKKYGMSLLGQRTNWSKTTSDVTRALNSQGHELVDSLYIRMMIEYGMVFLVVIMVLNCLLGKKCRDKRATFMSLAIIVMAIYGIVESNAISIVYNPLFIALGYLFLSGEDKDTLLWR